MAPERTTETTQLLRAWANGDREALEELTPRVYQEQRRIALHCMQRAAGPQQLRSDEG